MQFAFKTINIFLPGYIFKYIVKVPEKAYEISKLHKNIRRALRLIRPRAHLVQHSVHMVADQLSNQGPTSRTHVQQPVEVVGSDVSELMNPLRVSVRTLSAPWIVGLQF